jgi:K+-sensing histidine kinase KdpD
MINTLAENARKYTPEGGKVKIYAEQTDDYVEVSVCDTGCGLSAADVQRITDEKIYDPKNIGLDTASDVAQLKRSKGSGFGLMNCKGIIEKYRKTNAIFGVSCFRVESEPGKGSRFYFRLPKGLKKAFMVALVCIASLLQACTPKPTVEEQPKETWSPQYEALLDTASDYANDAYYANIDGEYEQTLAYVDSALQCLNKHYETYADEPTRYMQFVGTEQPAEFAWWESTYDTDFHIILDIRNEAAVACLALNRLDEYAYNNMVYTSLYKLLGEDHSLESYFSELQRSASQKLAYVWVIIVLLLTLPLGYYLLYYRRRQQEQRQLSRLLHIYQTVSHASQTNIVSDDDEVLLSEEDSLKEIPQRTLNQVADLFQRLFGTRQVVVALSNNAHKQLSYSCMDNTPLNADVEALIKQTYEATIPLTHEAWHAYPLVAQVSQRTECIGAIGICFPAEALQPSKRLLWQLLVRYLSIVLYNAVVKLSNQYLHIEEVQEANRRASWEDSQLYVQNQVLDNCLSAIKHETIYYPNRIRQILERLQQETPPEEEVRQVEAIDELIGYYKDVFTLLSSCASRQLGEVTFRRTRVETGELVKASENYFQRVTKKLPYHLELKVNVRPLTMIGDSVLLQFMLENLINEALTYQVEGELELHIYQEGRFVRFDFIDRRRHFEQEELNQLFYPHLSRMKQSREEVLTGTEYLICKQIIRDHDEFAGRRGCRINACQAPDGGFMVWFTIPCT